MKQFLFSSIILFYVAISFAQNDESSKFGLTIGGNYPWQSNNGELVRMEENFFPEPMIGFQGGVFYERDFGRFLLRPRFIAYRSRGEYNFPSSSPIYTLDKANVELLFGYEIFKNFSFLAGPAYQIILRNDFDATNQDLKDNMNSINILFGIKYKINKKFEISLLYDYTLGSDDFQQPLLPYNDNYMSFALDDAKIDIISLNLSFAIFYKDLGRNAKAKRGNRGCYF